MVTVRPACAADRPALTDLWREMDDLHARLLPRFFRRGAEGRRPEEIERVLAARDEAVLVAESERVVGLVHVLLYDTPPVPQLTPGRRAHVDTLVVAETARRQGIGRRLMNEASSWARSKGANEILLTVWAGNEAAERFYEAMGFRRTSSVLSREL